MKDIFKIPEVHPDFKLKSKHYNNSDLKEVAYSFIKEGEAYEAEVGKFLLDWLDSSKVVEVKTSGSTGEPKKIQLHKEQMRNSAHATGNFFKLKNGTKALLCLPATYIAGKMMLVRAMVLGWELDLVPPKSNPLDNLYKLYDFCAMTPFQLDNSLSRLHLIRKLIVGGGPVSPRLKKLVQDSQTKVYETYGMTETITHIAARRINPKKDKENIERPFKLLPNISISTDERDCLVIDAPDVAEGPIVTNDVVEIVTYKKFYWKGRVDNAINTGGIKIYPEEIEKKLQPFIRHRFFVAALPDDVLGDKLVLFVEADFSEEKLNTLSKKIKATGDLKNFEIPKKIFLIEKFEETKTGKIHRQNTIKARLA